MKEFNWKPKYITTKVSPVAVLPVQSSEEMRRVTEGVRNIERKKACNSKMNLDNPAVKPIEPIKQNDSYCANEKRFDMRIEKT